MGGRSKTIHLNRKLGIQQKLRELGQECVRFSFEHLDVDHHKFRLSECTADFLRHLMQTMLDYSKMTVDDFKVRDEDHHRHQIAFEETTEQQGFGLDPLDVGSDEPYQFGLCNEDWGSTGSWRVHGFFLGNVFHVRWLDHSHRLCTDERRTI